MYLHSNSQSTRSPQGIDTCQGTPEPIEKQYTKMVMDEHMQCLSYINHSMYVHVCTYKGLCQSHNINVSASYHYSNNMNDFYSTSIREVIDES